MIRHMYPNIQLKTPPNLPDSTYHESSVYVVNWPARTDQAKVGIRASVGRISNCEWLKTWIITKKVGDEVVLPEFGLLIRILG